MAPLSLGAESYRADSLPSSLGSEFLLPSLSLGDAALTLPPAVRIDGGDGGGSGPKTVLSPEEAALQAEEFGLRAWNLFHPHAQGVRSAVVYRTRAEGVDELPDEELQREVALSPRSNEVRERIVVELFRQAGAEEVHLQDIGRGAHNILVFKPGRTDRLIVVGGHHDKVFAGQGVIDNWTGASMVTNLYQALREAPTEHSFLFIAFGREEEGLLGSRYYVRNAGSETLGRMDGMLNLDTLAVDGTYSWQNRSDRKLLELIREVSKRKGLGLKEEFFLGGDSDSSSFRRAGVLAMTVFGCSPERISDIIHSEKDTIAYFSLPHYKNALVLSYFFVLALDQGRAPDGWEALSDLHRMAGLQGPVHGR